MLDDKVSLLLNGAVDYITKPFDMKELLARITVQLRRGSGQEPFPVLACGDLRLDTASHELFIKDIPVKLTLLYRGDRAECNRIRAFYRKDAYRAYWRKDRGCLLRREADNIAEVSVIFFVLLDIFFDKCYSYKNLMW